MTWHRRQQRISNIAYRGLLNGPALPGSVAAVRLTYLLGLPAIVDERDECQIPELLQLVGNRAVNRFRRPAYVIVSTLPTVTQMSAVDNRVEVFAVVRDHPAAAWTVWGWRDARWEPAGLYLPATASLDALAAAACDWAAGQLVIYEAPDVVSMYGERGQIAELDEEQLQQALRSYAGAGATITRVTALIERPAQAVAHVAA